jgi:outer membrane protein assembly factor BamB
MIQIKTITVATILITLQATLLSWDSGAANTAEWPGWRGPNRDGVSNETGLQTTWPEGGPKVMWEASVGTGYSSVAVAGKQVYTLGNVKDSGIVWCLNADTGKEIWRYTYSNESGKYPVPRMTPTLDGDRVFILTRAGELYCLNKMNGTICWQKNVKDYGARQNMNELGFSCSPLVFGDLLILDVGTIMAFNKNSGNLAWQCGEDRAGFSSPMAVAYNGQTFVSCFNDYGLILVHIETGKEFARVEWPEPHEGLKVATPIISADKIFISSCHNKEGLPTAGLFQIHPGGLKPLVKNSNIGTHIMTCVLWQGHLYGFDGMLNQNGSLMCLDFETLEVKWSQSGFKVGSVIVVGDKIIVLCGNGNLICTEATPTGFKQLGQAKVLSGKCWTVPVFNDGRIYCRNYRGRLLCLDVRNQKN